MSEHTTPVFVFVSFTCAGYPGQNYGHRVVDVSGDPWSPEAVEAVQRGLEELKGTNVVLLSYQPLVCPHCSGQSDG